MTNSSQKYDCLNGVCVTQETYDSPGLYASVAECEQACGPECNGKCLSNEEWDKITSLANRLKSKNCS